MPPSLTFCCASCSATCSGSIPFGLLLTRAAGLGDIRAIGSGNIGATNVLRTGRKGLAAATLLLDGLKGAAAVLIACWLAGRRRGAVGRARRRAWPSVPGLARLQAAARACATGYGVLIAVAWPVGLAAGAIWLVVAKVARISSLATLASFAAAPVLAGSARRFRRR